MMKFKKPLNLKIGTVAIAILIPVVCLSLSSGTIYAADYHTIKLLRAPLISQDSDRYNSFRKALNDVEKGNLSGEELEILSAIQENSDSELSYKQLLEIIAAVPHCSPIFLRNAV